MASSPSPESNQPPPPPPPPSVPVASTTDCSQGFCSPYCPQWCYVLFPPPPPFPFDPETADTSSAGPTFSPLVIAIIAILSCAFLLVAYYTFLSNFCGASFLRRRRRRAPPGPAGTESDNEDPARQSSRRRDQERHLPPPSTVGLDEALVSRIAVCKYERGDGLVGSTDCSVCLAEFREGESLRLLPECGHAFHVPCIDAWLKAHSNCPICRASIVAIASPPAPPADPVSEASDDPVVVVVLAGESTDRGTAGLENGTGGDRRLDRGNFPRPAANERFVLVGLVSSCFRCR